MNRFAFKSVAGATVIFILGWVSYPYLETGRLWYGVTGIDVSHHQGRIDWPTVARSGVSFAYLKATEGGDYVDSTFGQNWQEAKAAGIAVGAYHFYRLCKGGREQAENFLGNLPIEQGQLPPVIDVEDTGSCPDSDKTFDPVTEIEAFLDAVEAKAGCRPLLYVTPDFEKTFLVGKFGHERFWVRSILLPPLFRQDSWVFWQYHNSGRRRGIIGPVDLNAFRGDVADLAALIRASGCFLPDA